MTKTQALQKLYKKLTGEKVARYTDAKILSDLADKMSPSSGGGTSLVTNVYEMNEVTVKANKSKAVLVNFSTPIALSKIRAMWVQTTGRIYASLVTFDGNLSADQVYQIQYTLAFIPLENDTQSEVTITPKLYITMEE